MAKKKDNPNKDKLPLVKPNKRFERDIEEEFSDEQIIQFSKDLVSLRHEVDELKDEKKSRNKEYKDEIEMREVRMKELDSYIENGKGEVKVEVEVFLNMPNTGRKQICRVDNGALVEEVDMTQEELQVKMEFQTIDEEDEEF